MIRRHALVTISTLVLLAGATVATFSSHSIARARQQSVLRPSSSSATALRYFDALKPHGLVIHDYQALARLYAPKVTLTESLSTGRPRLHTGVAQVREFDEYNTLSWSVLSFQPISSTVVITIEQPFAPGLGHELEDAAPWMTRFTIRNGKISDLVWSGASSHSVGRLAVESRTRCVSSTCSPRPVYATRSVARRPAASTGFVNVLGVAVDSYGTVYVADNTRHRIDKLTRNGRAVPFAQFGRAFGPDQKDCVGLAIDSRNDLYVAGCSRYDLMELSPSGKLIRHWDSPSSFYYPAVRSGGPILATSFDDSTVYRLPAQGRLPSIFNSKNVLNPMGIAVDRAGNVYVALHRVDRVVKLSRTGKLLASSGIVAHPSNDSFLQGLAVDSHGNVYVSSAPEDSHDQVVRLSSNLRTATVFLKAGSKPGQVNNPLGLAVDKHDNLYVADNSNIRVQELSPAGHVLFTWHG